jgi:hypothetical protein
MTGIGCKSELERYESLFSDLWESAVVRFSTVNLKDGIEIPNAEVVFSQKELEQREEVLYSEGAFKIAERTVNDPFDLLWDFVEGETVVGGCVDIEMLEHRPERRFGDDRESRVFEGRPRTEIHAVFTVELSSDE